jgi:putative ABC transport system permease protein
MTTLIHDVRYSLRLLRQNPALASVAIGALALAVGANTLVFSVANAILFRSLPYPEPHRIVSINATGKGGLMGMAAYEFLDWKEGSAAFDHIAAYTTENYNLVGLGEPERLRCAKVSAGFFSLLGIQPALGRPFSSDEDRRGGNAVVVVGHGFWKRRFGGAPDILTKTITLNDRVHTIVGVMPESFRFPADQEVWLPLALDEHAERTGDIWTLVDVLGRLKRGVGLQQAQSDLELISRRNVVGPERRPRTVELVPLHLQLVKDVRRPILLLSGAVGFVLLIACANVASLLLARASARRREMAIRSALGAGRTRLVRQLLTESTVLAVIGGGAGIIAAHGLVKAAVPLLPESVALSVRTPWAIAIDWRVLLFSVGLSVSTGLLFGLAPAFATSRTQIADALKTGALSSRRGGRRPLRGLVVVWETAIAMVLLAGAGLMVKSVVLLSRIDPGFDPAGVLALRIDLPASRYGTAQRAAAFYEDLLRRLEETGGVRSAALMNHAPFEGFGMIAFFRLQAKTQLDRRKDRPVPVGAISPAYFATLRTPLLAGRFFDARDGAETPPVAIVNRALVRRFYPDEDPIGKKVSFACPGTQPLCRTIVGVVGDMRHEALAQEPRPELYVPHAQSSSRRMTLLVRATGEPTAIAEAVRDQIHAIDRDQPVYGVRTLSAEIANSIGEQRVLMGLLGAFAAIALALAALGVYAVVSYGVAQRTREFGIRMALGGERGDIFRLVLGPGAALAAAGIAAGTAGAWTLTRLMAGLLYEVRPADPATFAAVGLLLALVAMAAMYVPARRAARVDSMVALRYE